MPIGTLRTTDPPWDRKTRFSVCTLFSMMMLALSACGQNQAPATSANALSDPRHLASSAASDGRFSIDTPNLTNNGDKPNGWAGEIKPLEIRQGGSMGALGLNLDTYFAGNLNDTNARIQRLEDIVGVMHRDIKILAPSLQRLALIETDLQDLVSQLEIMLQEQGGTTPAIPTAPVTLSPLSQHTVDDSVVMEQSPPAPTPATPVPATPVPAPSAPAPAKAADTVGISALRFGGDHGKTRIVIDGGKPMTYTKDIDNNEKLLVIDVPHTAWNAASKGKGPASSVIESWSAQPNGQGGTTIVIALKKAVSVSYEGTMKPETANPHHRIVIDLKPN